MDIGEVYRTAGSHVPQGTCRRALVQLFQLKSHRSELPRVLLLAHDNPTHILSSFSQIVLSPPTGSS